MGRHWENRIVGTGEEPPDQLLANPDNWRVHPGHQRLALAEVLDAIGWVGQVIVNRRTGHVVDGHLRVDLAIERGEPTVPVLYVDLGPEEERLALATLDPIAGLAVADEALLARVVETVREQGEQVAEVVELLHPTLGDVDVVEYGEERSVSAENSLRASLNDNEPSAVAFWCGELRLRLRLDAYHALVGALEDAPDKSSRLAEVILAGVAACE